jgi:hypothetical protein
MIPAQIKAVVRMFPINACFMVYLPKTATDPIGPAAEVDDCAC